MQVGEYAGISRQSTDDKSLKSEVHFTILHILYPLFRFLISDFDIVSDYVRFRRPPTGGGEWRIRISNFNLIPCTLNPEP